MRGWLVWFIACFAIGWLVRGLGTRAAQISDLRASVRELARSTFDMEQRLRKLEGREADADRAEREFYDRLGL